MPIKHLKLIILFFTALLLASTVNAALDDLNLFYQSEDTDNSMVWPMLPNESLAELAAKFYPNNKGMQRKFIAKTKQLNKDSNVASNPNARSTKLTAIVIPNLEGLSVAAGAIQRSKKGDNKELRLSYNIKSEAEKAKEVFKNIPASLMRQYEELVVKNTFLKEELEKLNKRLVFLQNKLGELKLIMDRTLSLPPPKKKLKNLDVEKAPIAQQVSKSAVEVDKPVSAKRTEATTSFFDLSNLFLWLALLVLGLLFFLASYFYKKYQERKYVQLVNAISQQNQAQTFDLGSDDTVPNDQTLPKTTINNPTVEDHDRHSILQEAKTMVTKGSPDEAIAHLKWAIKAKPKTAINVWLYLLDLLRAQNIKDEFEKYAYQMHQNFNVMTPLWEEREVAMIVPQSLEEFHNISKLLTDKWPNPKLTNYLQKLVGDNTAD